MVHLLIRFTTLRWCHKKLLIEASWVLATAVIYVRYGSFRQLVPLLGIIGVESPHKLSVDLARQAREVEWALTVLVRHLPRPPTCLMLATAAQILLSRRKVPATVYLGVSSEQANDGRKFSAHAWLRCGRRTLTGKVEAELFKPLAWFGYG